MAVKIHKTIVNQTYIVLRSYEFP